MPAKAKRTRKRGGGTGRIAAPQTVFQETPEKVFTSREPVVRRRLLLVEADRHNIDELRDVFSDRGYECEVALELTTARNILTERMMDVTVINAAISGVNDEEIIREFRGRDCSMSLVIYNGTKDKARQRKLRSMGANSYLSTTSDLKAVAKAVINVLSTRR